MNLLRLLHLTVLLFIVVGVLKSSILMCLSASCSNIMRWTLTREVILSLRGVSPSLDRTTQLYITTLGCAGRRRGRRGGREKRAAADNQEIPVIIRHRLKPKHCTTQRQPILTTLTISGCVGGTNAAAEQNYHQPISIPTPSTDVPHSPSIYLLNAAALSKPGAVELLAADLRSFNSDVAIITETHFKNKHSNSVVGIDDYTIFRRDRVGRRGGGVAMYVRTSIQCDVWASQVDNCTYELLWVRVNGTFIGALYHPPAPSYNRDDLLDHIETCVGEITRDHPVATIVLAGDLNQLPDQDIVERTGLTQVVHQPTRGGNILDKVYVSDPHLFSSIHVVASVAKSDHRAVIAYACPSQRALSKTKHQLSFRPKTPNHHARFLQYIATVDVSPTVDAISLPSDPQAEYDSFYSTATNLLDTFYPIRSITVTSRDPPFITPEIKAKLRRKNRLMHAGRVEEAGALAARIGKEIARHSQQQLKHIDGRTNAKGLWAAVKKLTGRRQHAGPVDGITAEQLNNHYARISTDSQYTPPALKCTTLPCWQRVISESKVFEILDHLRPTAAGLDQLPAWFLRVGAPFFCQPVARLFNLSVATSSVPSQWKEASIRPHPKVPSPTQPAEFRPISVTPILTRILERVIVRRFLYPAFLSPMANLAFSNQFAFRPSGSPTAAIISILDTISKMLLDNPYVVVISIDFSKAFDSVRHYTLLEKLAQLDIPDQIYNWLVNFFSGHSHRTEYHGQQSTVQMINASIIQGSAIGPASYVVTAADLNVATSGNAMCKFADDTYLIIPARNVDSRESEIEGIEAWARINNLALNRRKTREIVFRDSRRKRLVSPPPPMADIERCTTLKILGVTITNTLSVSEHVCEVIKSCAQTQYALRILRAHGLSDNGLHTVFRSVAVAKIMYASCAWSGFANKRDEQRIDAFLRRNKKCGFCQPDLPAFQELCATADEQLFDKIRYNKNHLLHYLLPPPSAASQCYNLRRRPHSQLLPQHSGHLMDSNFITRILYKDIY